MPADVHVRVTSCTVHPSAAVRLSDSRTCNANDVREAEPRFVSEPLGLAGALQPLICVLVQAGLNAAVPTLNLMDRIFSSFCHTVQVGHRNRSRAERTKLMFGSMPLA